MREFLDRWYGDHCPPWTWPFTVLGIALATVAVTKVIVSYQ
jgi:hypothetical protein